MTLRELAKMANVSVGTVSKAFHHSPEIPEATRERIFAIAREAGCYYKYRQDKQERRVVAIICREIQSDNYVRMIEYLQSRLKRAQIDVLISFDDFDGDRQRQLIELYIGQAHVDGILVFNLMNEIPKGVSTPIVAINKFKEIRHGDAIVVNIHPPLTAAVHHLRELGHRHIAFLGEPRVRGKCQILRQILQQYEMSCEDLIEVPERFEEAGRIGVERLLEKHSPATAIICGYDNIAFGAIDALKAHGLRVPEDVSVIGMNNIPACETMERSLSTISEGAQAACDMACDLLMRKMGNQYYCADTQIEISGNLILRESTGECKTGG